MARSLRTSRRSALWRGRRWTLLRAGSKFHEAYSLGKPHSPLASETRGPVLLCPRVCVSCAPCRRTDEEREAWEKCDEYSSEGRPAQREASRAVLPGKSLSVAHERRLLPSPQARERSNGECAAMTSDTRKPIRAVERCPICAWIKTSKEQPEARRENYAALAQRTKYSGTICSCRHCAEKKGNDRVGILAFQLPALSRPAKRNGTDAAMAPVFRVPRVLVNIRVRHRKALAAVRPTISIRKVFALYDQFAGGPHSQKGGTMNRRLALASERGVRPESKRAQYRR